MATIALIKASPVPLRSLGADERWLQDQIEKDSSILGLGELTVFTRELRQPVGGRIDFLMKDIEDDIYYEVEIMLGTLDESHIIRTIEYWDIERQRRPNAEHRAVIVAEQITSRFFNVLRLLNRAVPLIAIKISAFKNTDGAITILPVTVLDVVEEVYDDPTDDPSGKSDLADWNKKSPVTVEITNQLVAMLKTVNVEARITYNRSHIAIGSTKRNFCWLSSRKAKGVSRIEIRFADTVARDNIVTKLQQVSIDPSTRETHSIAFGVTSAALTQHSALLTEALKEAETASR